MMQSFFNGLSGMLNFSKGLNQVSNNISNMNTAGYRGKDAFYESVVGDSGAMVHSFSYRDKDGEIRQTGIETDVAIHGDGFFILRNSGQTFYTRGGSFSFDENGYLTDKTTGYYVAGVDANGNLVDVNISELKQLAPQATSVISLSGNISSDGASHFINDIPTYTNQGSKAKVNLQFTDKHAITVKKTNDQGIEEDVATGDTGWNVNVLDSTGAILTKTEIRFDSKGALLEVYKQVPVEIATQQNNDKTQFKLDFSNVTQYATGTTSSASLKSSDGHAVVGMTKVSFDGDGILKITYSNGDEKTGPQLALAEITGSDILVQKTGSLFTVNDSTSVAYGKAHERSNGEIVGGSLELANIDLAEEFAEMMIIQRGYQASSRVMNISNEMIETLYGSTR